MIFEAYRPNSVIMGNSSQLAADRRDRMLND